MNFSCIQSLYRDETNLHDELNKVKDELSSFLIKLNGQKRYHAIQDQKQNGVSQSAQQYYYIINEMDYNLLNKFYQKFIEAIDQFSPSIEQLQQNQHMPQPQQSNENIYEVVEIQRKLINKQKAMNNTYQYVLRELKTYQAGTDKILQMIAKEGLSDGMLTSQQYNDFIKVTCPQVDDKADALMTPILKQLQSPNRSFTLPSQSFLDEQDQLFETTYNGIQLQFSQIDDQKSKLQQNDYEKLIAAQQEILNLKHQLQEFKQQMQQFCFVTSNKQQIFKNISSSKQSDIEGTLVTQAIFESQICIDQIIQKYKALKSKNNIYAQQETSLLKIEFGHLQTQLKKLEVLGSIINAQLKLISNQEESKSQIALLSQQGKQGTYQIQKSVFNNVQNSYIKQLGINLQEIIQLIKHQVNNLIQLSNKQDGIQFLDTLNSPKLTANNTNEQQDFQKFTAQLNQTDTDKILQYRNINIQPDNAQLSGLISSTSALNNEEIQIYDLNQSVCDSSQQFQRTTLQLLQYMNNQIKLYQEKLDQYQNMYQRKVDLIKLFNQHFLNIMAKYQNAIHKPINLTQ